MVYKNVSDWLNERPNGKEANGDSVAFGTHVHAAIKGFEAGRKGLQSPDSNVEKNRELLLQRSIVGLQKYGVTTDKANLTQKEWLHHALEEALDLANYLQAEISRAEEQEVREEKLKEFKQILIDAQEEGCERVNISEVLDNLP